MTPPAFLETLTCPIHHPAAPKRLISLKCTLIYYLWLIWVRFVYFNQKLDLNSFKNIFKDGMGVTWSSWSTYKPAAPSQNHTQDYNNPSPVYGGNQCLGSSNDITTCTPACEMLLSYIKHKQIITINPSYIALAVFLYLRIITTLSNSYKSFLLNYNCKKLLVISIQVNLPCPTKGKNANILWWEE